MRWHKWVVLTAGSTGAALRAVALPTFTSRRRTGALFRRGETWNVYVAKDGRAQDREIQLLRRSGRFAAVGTGLVPGERVIVYPSDRIASGVRVEVR
jgi:multidrug efflux pump subunit AcrA (membrane-fusion protein)